MQGLVAVPISCMNVRARRDEASNDFCLVRRGGDVQCGVALDDVPPDLVQEVCLRALASCSCLEAASSQCRRTG